MKRLQESETNPVTYDTALETENIHLHNFEYSVSANKSLLCITFRRNTKQLLVEYNKV